jgi:hypothetical protein
MPEDRAPYHTIEDDPDLVRPFEPRPVKYRKRMKKPAGQGGSRHGYVSENEIEDMTLFDEDPGKEPSKDGIHDPKSIDPKGHRERK